MPARKRIDPKSTPADGSRHPERVLKRDPAKHYVWVNPNDEDCGVSSYLANGYEIERQSADGVLVPRGNAKDGVWTFKGQVLMSCPLEDEEARRAEGQSMADAVDRRILRDGQIEDGLRGRGYRLGVDGSQTSKPYTETEQGA